MIATLHLAEVEARVQYGRAESPFSIKEKSKYTDKDMLMIRTFLIAICLSLLAACTTATKVDLKYAPPASIQPAKTNAAVKVGSFVDSRGETKTWIGTIRGGFGNHLKDLDTTEPLRTVVEQAFKDALAARGVSVNSSTSPVQISGVIKTLIGDQVVKREANVAIEVSLIDNSTGQTRFTRSYTSNVIEGSAPSMSTGVFASVEDLRAIIEKALRETVDKALDDSALRAALQI